MDALKVLLVVHVAISLLAIPTGLVALTGLAGDRLRPAWICVFLAATILTCLTGFPLPPFGWDPARVIGVITLLAALAAAVGLYVRGLAGAWRGTFVIASVAAFHLNIFVAIVQAFQKVGPLRAIAPTQADWPFGATQAVALLGSLLLGGLAFRRLGRMGGARGATPIPLGRAAP